MPAGWQPTPVTPEQRAATFRRFAAEARQQAADEDATDTRWDRSGRSRRAGQDWRARADHYDHLADQYEQLAELRRREAAEAAESPEPERPRRRTFVIGG